MDNPELLQLNALACVSCDKPILVIDEKIGRSMPEAGVDAFGLYHYDGNESWIGIDYEKTANWALAQNLNPEEVVTIIRLHELSHYVTHRGRFILTDQEWSDFGKDKESPDPEEMHAQGFIFLWIVRFRNSPSLLKAFKTLSDHSPPRYRQWTVLESEPFQDAWWNMVSALSKTRPSFNLNRGQFEKSGRISTAC